MSVPGDEVEPADTEVSSVELLRRLARSAADVVPGADGASVTVFDPQQAVASLETSAASDRLVAEIDEIQYVTVREGPGLTAAREQQPVSCGSLGGDPRWTHFGPRAGRAGVHSALSLPLVLSTGAIGALDVYARAKDTFDEHAITVGRAFAAAAAQAVHGARLFAREQDRAANLEVAIANRPIIDQAIGLIRGRSGVSVEQAMARLRAISQDEQVKLNTVAHRIVDQAVRRAASRGES